MPFSDAFKNAMLQAVPPDFLSLHNGSPGAAGGNELSTSTGSPFYARKAPTWNAAGTPTQGAKTLSNTPIFDVYSGASVTAVGFWRTGTYYGYVTVTTETYGAQGTYTVTGGTIDLNATASA